MDISNIFRADPTSGAAFAPDPDDDIDDIDGADPSGTDADMTPVQRIKAFREGSLLFPDINPDDDPDDPDEPDDSGDELDDLDDLDDSDHEPQPGTGTEPSAAATDPSASKRPPLRTLPAIAWIKKHRVPAAAIGALLVAGLITTLATPGKDDHPAPSAPGRNSTTSRNAPPAAPQADAPIHPTVAEVMQTQCVSGSTPPMEAFSAKSTPAEKNTAWKCQTPLGAPGTTLTATLPSWSTITAVAMIPGFDGKDEKGQDNWPRYGLICKVMWYFDDGQSREQTLTSDRKLQTLKFDAPVYSKTVKLVILETAPVPRDQVTSPTSTAGSGPIVGDLGKWGQALGGESSPALPSTPDKPTAGPSAFASSLIQIIGHQSR